MPTYDYKCTDCGNKFETFQPITAPPLTECPECKGNIKRLISAGGIPIFKGTGFYQTDYKNAQSSGSAKKDNSNGSNGNKEKTTVKNNEKAVS